MDKVDISQLEKRYKRTRFLNNEASKRFRLRKRTEKESVNVSRVVLQSVNGLLRQREQTLIKLKEILHQACLSGESKEEAYRKLQEEIQKDANMNISNQRLIRESVKLRTVPIITIAECEGIDAIFKRPMKKGPGILSQVKDDSLPELLDLMEQSKNNENPSVKSPIKPTEANRVPPLIPLIGMSERKPPVPSQIKTKTFLSKREPSVEKGHHIKTLLTEVNFSVEIIPLRKNVPRSLLQPTKPDVSITLVKAKPQTSVLMPRPPIVTSSLNTKKTTPASRVAVSPPVFNEKNSLVGGKRKPALEIFPQIPEKKWICPANSTLPNLTIKRIKSEPSGPGTDTLFPLSEECQPNPPQIVEVSKEAAILWNINVVEAKSQDCIKVEPVDSDPAATFIQPKLEKEDYFSGAE